MIKDAVREILREQAGDGSMPRQGRLGKEAKGLVRESSLVGMGGQGARGVQAGGTCWCTVDPAPGGSRAWQPMAGQLGAGRNPLARPLGGWQWGGLAGAAWKQICADGVQSHPR